MKRMMHYIAVAVLMVLSICSSAEAQRQTRARLTGQEILGSLQVGQWVKMEGMLQSDNSVLCIQVETLTGDFLDDDWQMNGIVTSTNPDKQEFYLLNLLVKAHEESEYQSEVRTMNGVKDMVKGMMVEVEGTYLKDGTFLLKEVQEDQPKQKDLDKGYTNIEVQGRVGNIDSGTQSVNIMGVIFRLTERTQATSAIK